MGNYFCLSEYDQQFYLDHGFIQPIDSMYEDDSYGDGDVPNMVGNRSDTHYIHHSKPIRFHNYKITIYNKVVKSLAWKNSYSKIPVGRRTTEPLDKVAKMPYLFCFCDNNGPISLEQKLEELPLTLDIVDFCHKYNIVTFKDLVDTSPLIYNFFPDRLYNEIKSYLDGLNVRAIKRTI